MGTDSVRFHNNPKYAKILEWGKLLSITGAAQISIQVIGLVSGLIIIRLLPTQEYALYTLVNTMLGTMTVLSDGGIGAGVMAQGGKVWQDKDRLGIVLATGLYLRKKFAIGSLAISLPILLFLLVHQGAGIVRSLVIVAALIPAFYAALSDSLYEIGPKLHQQVKSLQANQLWVSVLRLILTSASVFVFPWTAVTLLANGIPRIYGNVSLKKLSYEVATKGKTVDKDVERDILKVVKRMLPEIIYYCISGQLNIWIISLLGSTMALASLGALGRLGMVLSFFTALFNMLIVPRFARLPMVKKAMFKYFFSIFTFIVVFSILVIFISSQFSYQILFVLGEKYFGLQKELVLSIANSCVSLFGGCFFSMLISRGWAIRPIQYIIVNISTTIIAASVVNVTSLSGVLIFNIIISTVQAIVLSGYCYYKILKVKEV